MQMRTVVRGPQTYNPADASRTLTITNDPTQESDEETMNPEDDSVIGALILRGGDRRTQRVAWGEDVVDNEGCGKKKSKICCIYHKPRRFDESSSEESSDSDSECRHNHDPLSHSHLSGGSSSNGQQMRDGSSVVVHEEHPEPNAYEKQPHSKKGKRKHT